MFDIPSAREAVTSLQAIGTRCVVLTVGEKGLLYTVLLQQPRQGGEASTWTDIQLVEARKVDVVDTTVSVARQQRDL